MGASNFELVFISSTWDCTTFHNFLPMFKKKIQKLAGLWLAGEVVNHVGIYGSKAAEGLSAFQRRSCFCCNSDVCSASVTAVLCAVSFHIGQCHSDIQLYILFYPITIIRVDSLFHEVKVNQFVTLLYGTNYISLKIKEVEVNWYSCFLWCFKLQ